MSLTFVHFHVITTSEPTTALGPNPHQVGHRYRKHHQDQLNFVKDVMSYFDRLKNAALEYYNAGLKIKPDDYTEGKICHSHYVVDEKK